ncbi:hypothetical protein [Salinisphaera japonica]|uniref:Uncharacterized protein n=1 Tax=Salinisphaera japonica YTM-1 TaxID=1209778 RepID=A0A423PPV6_9GAMM|nr:hypothetical protein [Salinisphaera japonica]ROO27582.1 hypothetical protein SAJA_09095 [Salinisphaera japonica YTM-1]
MTCRDDVANLRRCIRVAAAGRSGDALLQAMGYRRVTAERRARLRAVLADDLLGLEAGGFDFRYDARGFVRALCEALGMLASDYEAGLRAMETTAAHRRTFAPYIAVDTNFRRSAQPLFVLAMLECQRRIHLPRGLRDLSAVGQIHQARDIVVAHYRSHAGRLEFWGDITVYRFFYEPGACVIFDTHGDIETIGPASGQHGAIKTASLSIGGRDLSQAIG